MSVTVVVPTIGRSSLAELLSSLAASAGARPERIVLVDDRRDPTPPLLAVPPPGWTAERVAVHRSGGRGPAAARNVGWRAAGTEWVAFLDDDVRVSSGWLTDLDADLTGAADDVAGVQGRIEVPLPIHRRPTDAERDTAGLATARWITADLAYRRAVLAELGGFDERFPRAFREDADLGLRVIAAGRRLTTGARRTVHPPRVGGWAASLRAQRGNADDALMRRLHGPHWHAAAGTTRGRRPVHLAVTAVAVVSVGLALAGRRRAAVTAAAGWTAATAQFAWLRVRPGPRDPAEVTRMVLTSALIPPAATGHWLRGLLRHRTAGPWCSR